MKKDAQFWKEYRLKNSEKLKAYKKQRYHAKKRSTLPLDASKYENHIPIPKPQARTCQASFCTKEAREVLVHGLKAWLCVDHG